MSLFDHFHPPLSEYRNWEGLHSAWANSIVTRLNEDLLPERYFAEPTIRWGQRVEIDVATIDVGTNGSVERYGASEQSVRTATAIWSPPAPTQSAPFSFADQDVAEVRIVNDEAGPRLVAAIELVSPGNKDRPATRDAFVRKCAAYLQQRVGLIVVDVVTSRAANLHERLLELLQQSKTSREASGALYTVAYRIAGPDGDARMEYWSHSLKIGGELPTLPLWIADEICLPLDLATSYAAACRSLRIAK
jgi:hypothetical protein